jgi:two-component system sensor histidine kinase GlrK
MSISLLTRRPRLIQQWVAATLLAMLPLAIAFGYALWSLQQQAQTQRDVLQHTAELNQLDATVAELIKELERSARHYLLLGERAFLDSFAQKRELLAQRRRRIAELMTAPPPLAELDTALAGIDAHLRSGRGDLHSLDAPFNRAHRLADQLSAAITGQARAERARRDAELDAIRRRLLLIGALAIPATLLLVMAGSIAVSGPLRRLTSAIRHLGHGEWQQPVTIAGPEDFVQLGERLEWMRLQLLAADQQKQTFARHITHELKSPLAAIMEATALLADAVPGPVTAEQRQVLRILQDNAGHLQGLIQQLLDYNAVASGTEQDRRDIDLPALCRQIQARLSGLDPARTLRWQFDGEPPRVVGDPQLVEMILSNLLSNAVHFSPPGGLIAVRWGAGGDGWWLSVADQGPGIAESDTRDIFKPFFQGRSRRRGPLKGSGMGLAIVRECVNRLDGEIAVQSAPGAGSRFELRFPSAASAREPHAAIDTVGP